MRLKTAPVFYFSSFTAYAEAKGGMSVLMSFVWTGMVVIALIAALFTGRGSELAAAVSEGAQAGITLVISLSGSVCLWTGVGRLMEKAGFTTYLSKLLRPAIGRLFPSCKNDTLLAGHLSANICANFLGLGNAATPMGIQAAQRMAAKCRNGIASDELCRLIVLNTASIQLIPANVAAVRSALGCSTPFDILPAVWCASLSAAFSGLLIAGMLGRLWKK